MRLAFGRRAWIVLALAVVSAVAAARLLDQPAPIAYYRVVDDRTIVVGADSGPGAWVRVTSVIETPAAVTISMSSFLFRPGPGTAEAVPYESTVTLGAALENRTVIDGSSGRAVLRANCPPPAVFATVCS